MKGLADSFSKINSNISTKANLFSNQNSINDRDVLEIFNEANNLAKTASFGGPFIIVDEFGKFLEYAAQHPEKEDIFTLQHLAELAERSNPPIILVTVLHTAFSEYLHILDRSQQFEWNKVQGRFTSAPFLEPHEQLIYLIGTSIDTNFSPEVKEQYQNKIDHVLTDEALSEAKKRLHLGGLLSTCIPLDPITTLVLPSLFRSKFTQNERSLFAFLTSSEPFGFQDFLARSVISGANVPFYRLDLLYDYVIKLGKFCFYWRSLSSMGRY